MERSTASLVQVVLLAFWLGAAVFFGSVVAPALFAVLPSRTLAGAVVGLTLPAILYSGMAVGAFVLVLQVAMRRGWRWKGRELAALITIVACGIAQFGVGPRIARLRTEIGGPIESLPFDDARRVAFGRLHGISVAWLGLAMLAAFICGLIAARAVRRDTGA
ncbi:MAG TPA: DUF4149 domain-containing protein [Gemmatimonadaceae bacterium]